MEEDILTRRLLSIITYVALLNLMSGCHSAREIPVHEFWEHSTESIVTVVTKSGDVIEFPPKSPANYDLSRHAVIGQSISGLAIEIPTDDIIWVKVRQFDTGKTIAFAILETAIIGGVIVGIGFLIFLSSIEN